MHGPFLSNVVRAVVEAHAMHAAANHASAWGSGTEVCVRMGHQRPSVHVQGHRRPSVHVQWNTTQTRKHMEPQQPKTFNPEP